MRKLLLSLLLVVLAVALLPLPVQAIADPDSAPSINAVYVYENVLEDGDLGVLVDIYLDYAVLPTETATDAYVVVFIDTDGVSQLKSASPYTYQSSGYRRNLVWIRFTPAEVTALSIDSIDEALYRIWLIGNPALTWAPGPDPPKTAATIDQWSTVADPSSVIALRVLYYADVLEVLWSLDLIEETAVGSALTTLGASYFTNVISDLRTIAPLAFSSREIDPTYVPISYDTAFGATVTDEGTATVVGEPITLASGTTTIDTGATVGTIIIDLAQWTYGTIDDNTGTIAGAPVDLTPGTNTVTVTGAGTFDVAVAVVDSVTIKDATVIGTGLDLTTLGTAFGMSRWMVSGLIWMLITLILCAAVYRGSHNEFGDTGMTSGASQSVMYVFSIAIIGGWLLGLLHPLVVALLIIISGGFIGYVLFFKSETLHKGFMFMVWMFIMTSLAGNMAASGASGLTATRLTADITSTETSTIAVASTDGFPDSGYIKIGDEYIGYPEKTATTFRRSSFAGVTTNPLTRGEHDTTAAAHSSNDKVYTRETGILNASLDYRIARFADAAGSMDFMTIPRLFGLVGSFFTLPLQFLGTDLAVLTVIWGVFALGLLVGFLLQLAGGRRV